MRDVAVKATHAAHRCLEGPALFGAVCMWSGVATHFTVTNAHAILLLLLRWDYNIPGMVDAAKSLADLQAKGLIKQVGLTNMNVEAVTSIVDAGVPVANNQVGYTCRVTHLPQNLDIACRVLQSGRRGGRLYAAGCVGRTRHLGMS